LRAQGSSEASAVQQQSDLVRGRIADTERDRILAVGCQQWRQPTLDLGERFFPAGFDEDAVALDQRRAQSIGIVVQVLERGTLGTDEASAEDVLLVASDRDDLIPSSCDLEPTSGFT
jgi:hypothetical protein